MAEILSKSAYARVTGVNPAAVSNWIRRGQLTSPALRTDGKINRELADQQLGHRLAPVMSAARRAAPADDRPIPSSTGGPAWSPSNQASLQLLRARALDASVRAERSRRELNQERGRYTLTEEAQVEWAKTLSAFLLNVEQSLADLATTLRLDREGVMELRRWWRNQRAQAAGDNREKAAGLPQFIEDNGAA